MPRYTYIFLILIVSATNLICQKFDSNIDIDKKPRNIDIFLREELSVLPGDQAYRAEDIWREAGSKKIKISIPTNPNSKDILRNITIEDAGDLIDGFNKFIYNSRNETITNLLLITNLSKGDYLLDKFKESSGVYKPDVGSKANIEFSGVYYFDDFHIRITEFSDEKMEFKIFQNPEILRKPKQK